MSRGCADIAVGLPRQLESIASAVAFRAEPWLDAPAFDPHAYLQRNALRRTRDCRR